jgi:hypothetical protein
MRSNSETGYGARINNAEKLITALKNCKNYQPQKPELAISTFSEQVAAIKDQNKTVATKKQSYSLAVDARKNIFTTNDNSIKKNLSPINATIKSSFGKTAKESTDVASMIAKIRGANAKTKNTVNPDQVTVSQSYRSYGSQIQMFNDVLTNLANFGDSYTPSNPNLTIDSLTKLAAKANELNNNVMDNFTQLKQNNDSRLKSYDDLNKIAIRIKDSIKAQYGNTSSEYKVIKGLNF